MCSWCLPIYTKIEWVNINNESKHLKFEMMIMVLIYVSTFTPWKIQLQKFLVYELS